MEAPCVAREKELSGFLLYWLAFGAIIDAVMCAMDVSCSTEGRSYREHRGARIWTLLFGPVLFICALLKFLGDRR